MTDLDQSIACGEGRRPQPQDHAGRSGGLALPLLAARGGGDDSAGSPCGAASSASSDASAGSDASASSDGAGGGTSVAAADVPVGGGLILKDEKIVVTQPRKGDLKAFTAVRTHRAAPWAGWRAG